MFKLGSILKSYASSEDANFSIVASIVIGFLTFSVAGAVDYSRVQSTDSELQNSLDVATIHAARTANEGDFNANGLHSFNSNFEDSASSYDVDVVFSLGEGKVTGTASAKVPLTFSKILGKEYVQVEARSVVNLPEGGGAPCIMALSRNRNPGILLNSGANLSLPDCGMHVHSVASPAFTMNGGATLDAEDVCIAGDRIINNTGQSLNNVTTGCAVAADPYVGAFPEPDSSGCDYRNQNYNSHSISMSPGVYCGRHNFNNSNASVTFAPGLYILKDGGWNVNGGTWQGDGVTFYYVDRSNIQFNSAVAAKMTAPTSGPYANVFMTESPSITKNSQVIMNDDRGFDFEGIIYLPSRNFIFNSGATLRSRTMELIANTIIFNNANIEIKTITSSNSQSGLVYLSE